MCQTSTENIITIQRDPAEPWHGPASDLQLGDLFGLPYSSNIFIRAYDGAVELREGKAYPYAYSTEELRTKSLFKRVTKLAGHFEIKVMLN